MIITCSCGTAQLIAVVIDKSAFVCDGCCKIFEVNASGDVNRSPLTDVMITSPDERPSIIPYKYSNTQS